MSLKHTILTAICLFTVTAFYASDQKPSNSSWTRSVFYKFINRNKIQTDNQALVDRRNVALDAIEDELKPKRGLWGWIQSFWSKPLYDAPIIAIESAEIDEPAQAKAVEMAKRGGYGILYRDKPGRSEESKIEQFKKTHKYAGEIGYGAATGKAVAEFAEYMEPDAFLKFNVQQKNLGELLKERRQQNSTTKQLIPVTDPMLDYKLGKSKIKEELKLLNTALDTIENTENS